MSELWRVLRIFELNRIVSERRSISADVFEFFTAIGAIWTWCIFLTSLGSCDSSQSRNCYGLGNLLLEFTFWLESV